MPGYDQKLHVKSCEISLTNHCVLNCAGCSHASPHLSEFYTPVDIIQRDLYALKDVLVADELRVAGGEPLLHPQLIDILRISKESGVADKVTLITNGVLLNRAPELLWKHIDHLRISMYKDVKTRWQKDAVLKLGHLNNVTISLDKIDTFQNVFLNRKSPPFLRNIIFKYCSIAHLGNCHLVHIGRFYKCPEAGFMQERLQLIGIDFQNKDADSVLLHDNPNLKEELYDAIYNSKKPLRACEYCLGTMGASFSVHQLTGEELAKELNAPHKNILSLIGLRESLKSFFEYYEHRFSVLGKLRLHSWMYRGNH